MTAHKPLAHLLLGILLLVNTTAVSAAISTSPSIQASPGFSAIRSMNLLSSTAPESDRPGKRFPEPAWMVSTSRLSPSQGIPTVWVCDLGSAPIRLQMPPAPRQFMETRQRLNWSKKRPVQDDMESEMWTGSRSGKSSSGRRSPGGEGGRTGSERSGGHDMGMVGSGESGGASNMLMNGQRGNGGSGMGASGRTGMSGASHGRMGGEPDQGSEDGMDIHGDEGMAPEQAEESAFAVEMKARAIKIMQLVRTLTRPKVEVGLTPSLKFRAGMIGQGPGMGLQYRASPGTRFSVDLQANSGEGRFLLGVDHRY